VVAFENAFATPTKILRSNNFPRGTAVTGCLYDSSGRIIKSSKRFGGFDGDFFPSVDPEVMKETEQENIKTISGRGLYLGHFIPQYGHFLIETLSTFWLSDRFDSYDYFLFQPFVFGTQIPVYAVEAFYMLGLPLEKIIFVDGYLKLERIDVAERLVKFNYSANVGLRTVFDLLRERACASKEGQELENESRCYYISRKYQSWRKGSRVIINEPLLERKMERLGFKVIYPERMNFRTQIRTMASADVIVGLSGSALHNCLFMRPNALLIELCDIRSLKNFHPMQSICNLLGSANSRCVPFSGWIVDSKMRMGFINVTETMSNIRKELGKHSLSRLHGSNSNTNPRLGFLAADKFIRYFSDLALMTKSCLRVLLYRARRYWGNP
jgi:hypothetical protein